MLEGDDGTRRGDRITELYAFLGVDPADDCEGILISSTRPPVPLIGADRARVESYRPYARRVAEVSGHRIRLVRFSDAEVLEEFTVDSDAPTGYCGDHGEYDLAGDCPGCVEESEPGMPGNDDDRHDVSGDDRAAR